MGIREDAARYQWLRRQNSQTNEIEVMRWDEPGNGSLLHGEELDTAIDARLCAHCAAADEPYNEYFTLTPAQMTAVAESMPGGLEGFMKGWGWQQFAHEIMDLANRNHVPTTDTRFMLVPKTPTARMIEAAREFHEGEAYLPVSLYRAMLLAHAEESMRV